MQANIRSIYEPSEKYWASSSWAGSQGAMGVYSGPTSGCSGWFICL
ncbi:hypothetical protein LINPERPRIM_LOCUS2896 [Linum perenne]